LNFSDQSEPDKTTVKEVPSLLFKGFCMGSADVVPGVSGGTMALILGIYERFVESIKSFNIVALKSLLSFRLKDVFGQVHWLFLGTLLVGILSAVIFFTRVVKLPQLMFESPEPVYGLFFGLIVGSVWYVARSLGKMTVMNALWMLLGVAIGLRIVTLVPTDTPEVAWFVFLSGAISITAMILPGISGSFILLILRKYDYILMQFGLLGGSETMSAILVLIPFGLGLVTGIILFSRVLSWLLKHYHTVTLCILIGFMIGSLYVIWPFQDREYVESVRTEVVQSENDGMSGLLEPQDTIGLSEYQATPDSMTALDAANDEAQLSESIVKLDSVKGLDLMAASGPQQNTKPFEESRSKLKLIKSEPFIPLMSKADSDARLSNGITSVYLAIVMMFVGLFAVVGIAYRESVVKRRAGLD
jgi:putative membrane protein